MLSFLDVAQVFIFVTLWTYGGLFPVFGGTSTWTRTVTQRGVNGVTDNCCVVETSESVALSSIFSPASSYFYREDVAWYFHWFELLLFPSRIPFISCMFGTDSHGCYRRHYTNKLFRSSVNRYISNLCSKCSLPTFTSYMHIRYLIMLPQNLSCSWDFNGCISKK